VSDPYKLPNGNVQICFSGGRTSGYMLHKILERNGPMPDRAKVIFTNTGREMNATLDFVAECAARWDVPIEWLEYKRNGNSNSFHVVNHNQASRNGEPFRELVLSRKYLPNVVARYCTAELKVRTSSRYLKSLGWDTWHNALGIRADESRRVNHNQREKWENWYPLNDAGISKKDVANFWSRMPFDLRLENVNGNAPKGNCDGCFLKSEATLAAMWREHPDRMQWWADLEAEAGSTFHKSRSYSELGDFVRNQGDWIFDNEGLLCQANDGECTG